MIIWRHEFWTGWTWHCDVCQTLCGGAVASVSTAADEHVCPEWIRQ